MRKNNCHKRNDLFCWFLICEKKKTVHSIFAPVVCAVGHECFLTRYISKSAIKFKVMNTTAKMLRYEPPRQWKVRVLFSFLSVNSIATTANECHFHLAAVWICVWADADTVSAMNFEWKSSTCFSDIQSGRPTRTHVAQNVKQRFNGDFPVHRIQWAEFRLEKRKKKHRHLQFGWSASASKWSTAPVRI